MKKIDKFIAVSLQVTMVACLSCMIIMVFTNVVLRYLFNSGISYTEEISRLTFLWLTFLGAILAMRDHNHLGVDILVRRLPVLVQKVVMVLVELAMLYICYLLVIGSWQQMMLNWTSWSPVTGVPFAAGYATGFVGGLGIGAYLIASLVKILTSKVEDNDLVMVVGNADAESAQEIVAEATRTTSTTQR